MSKRILSFALAVVMVVASLPTMAFAASPTSIHTVAVGKYHTLAVKNDGSLWSWTHFAPDNSDSNLEGQLGDGTTTPRSTPAKIMDGVASVYTYYTHSMALKKDGSLWEWGEYTPSLGFPPEPGTHNTPVKVMDDVVDMLDPYKNMGTDMGFSLALKKDGSLWLWGHSEAAWKREARFPPYKVMDNVMAITDGMALQSDGTLLRFYAEYDYYANKPKYGFAKVTDNVECIVSEKLIIKKDSALWELGYSAQSEDTTLKKILDNVAFAIEDEWAISKDGGLYVWGLGYRTYDPGEYKPDKPVRVCDNVISLTSYLGSVTADFRDGTQKTWGYYQALASNYKGVFIVNGIDPYYNNVRIGVFRGSSSSGSSIELEYEPQPLLYSDTLKYYYYDDVTDTNVPVATMNVNDIAFLADGTNGYYIVCKNGNLLFQGTEKKLDGIMIPDKAVPPQSTISDKPSSWAESQVTAAITANLVPQSLQSKYTQPTTRAEFCALAVALYENVKGEITGRSTFTDTTDVNVQKAAAIGIVSGIGNNKFDPNSSLTREQAATMLSRLASAIGKPLTEQDASFNDNSRISSWAADAAGQMQTTGIMGGVGNNTFSPQGAYTREQSIVTILRLYDVVK